MQVPSDKRPDRGDAAPHDLDIVDEAIINAVAHSDYAISARISACSCADRLELYSLDTLTLDDMPYRAVSLFQYEDEPEGGR